MEISITHKNIYVNFDLKLFSTAFHASDIALIYSVDWFLDRIRTSTNVWGDAVGCGILQHLVGDELNETYAHQVDDE